MNKFLLTTSILSVLYSTSTLAVLPSKASILSTEIQDTDMDKLTTILYSNNKLSANGNITIGRVNNNAAIYNHDTQSTIILGTFKSDGSGTSEAIGISSNGNVVVGSAASDNGQHAFRYDVTKNEMIDLGTLKANNSGNSYAFATSADGRVTVGDATSDNGQHAFRHNEGDNKLTDLGTLKTDNSGNSLAYDVSANGKVVVGGADTENGSHAFRHNEGALKMTDLGTLKNDNSGDSLAKAVSADGKVVIGHADSDKGVHAFRHNEGDAKMTDLGTLKADNTGSSYAYGISEDGNVIVGTASSNNGLHAFRHNEGDAKVTDLGTLRADNSGNSFAYSTSANGNVVVGMAINDSNEYRAFRHNEGDSKVTDLGTLKADNTGNSRADSVSSDGLVVGGIAENDLGIERTVLWKSSKAVDLENTINSMKDSTQKAKQVLGLYEGQLISLADSHCSLNTSNYCLGIYSDYSNVRSSDILASGIFGAKRIANSNLIIGGSVNFNTYSDLVRGYKSNGTNLPGLGAFMRYESNKDLTGLISELSGSYLKQNLQITRQAQEGAEQGYGESKLHGYLVNLKFGYGIKTSEKSIVTPRIGIRHHDISRDAYSEIQDADFLASYSKLGTKSTELLLTVNSQYQFSPQTSFNAEVGTYTNISHDYNDAEVSIDYIGNYKDENATQNNSIKPFFRLGINHHATQNSVIGLNATWSKTNYEDNLTQVGVAYSYHW